MTGKMLTLSRATRTENETREMSEEIKKKIDENGKEKGSDVLVQKIQVKGEKTYVHLLTNSGEIAELIKRDWKHEVIAESEITDLESCFQCLRYMGL